MVVALLVSILLIAASPVIIVSNLLIVAAWFRFKRLRTPSNAFIMSLATADFSFGVCLPMAVIYELVAEPSALTLTQSHGQRDFNIRAFSILIVFSAASLLSIAAIALDRFTSVAQPLRYNHFVTTSYVHRFVLAVWIYAIVMGTVGFISQPAPPAELLITWLTLFVFAPCVICCILSYWYIYMVARSHARAIHSVEISLSRGVCSVHRNNEDQESPASSTIIATTHHPSYGLTLALILGMLFLCWTPLLVSGMLDHFAQTDILNSEDGRALASAPILLNSLVNPWLYGFRSSEIRLAASRIVDALFTRLTGRPPTLLTCRHKELTSCASNVRLLAVSPTQTTVQCYGDRNHLQIVLCDQTQL